MKSEEEIEVPVARWSTLNTAIKYVGGYKIVLLVFLIQSCQTVFQQIIEQAERWWSVQTPEE